MLIRPYTSYVRIEKLCFSTKIVLGICTPVACVLLFRMKNSILTTSSRYRCGSRMLNCLFPTAHILKCLIVNFG
jgi:hypothetical protein